MAESEDTSEASPNMANKRKRSARVDGSSKAQKNLENESSSSTIELPHPIEFTILLSNANLLAKITKGFSTLQD